MWCVLKHDYTLNLYTRKGNKKADKIILVPGQVIQYGDEELKSDMVVPEKDRKKVISITMIIIDFQYKILTIWLHIYYLFEYCDYHR